MVHGSDIADAPDEMRRTRIDKTTLHKGFVMGQLLQVCGSVLVLVAFALAQRGVLDQKSSRYLVLNVVGSAILAVQALVLHQWGFLLLEGVWALVSAVSLVGVLRRPADRGIPASDRLGAHR